jgi:hypothetical protein
MNNMRLLAKNIRTFLLALVLGLSVWVSAVSAADPNEVHHPTPSNEPAGQIRQSHQ